MRKLLWISLLLFACDKSPEVGVTIHCNNLVNETLPAGDNAKVFVPNAFTPNGDGLNDVFRPIAYNIASITVKIYDDNSQLVFQTTQINEPWDPGLLPTQFEKYYVRVEAITLQSKKIGQCIEVYALNCKPRNSQAFYFEDQVTPNGFTGVTNETLSLCN